MIDAGHARREVAVRLASYNLMSVAVCDAPARCWARSPSTTCSIARCRQLAGGAATPAGAPGGAGEVTMTRREDLSTPRRRRRLGLHYDPESFGEFCEASPATSAPPASSCSRAASSSSGSSSTSFRRSAAVGPVHRSSSSTSCCRCRPPTRRR